MNSLTPQQLKVYQYIATHRGCTTHDIQRDIFVECPSGRISEIRTKLGDDAIISIGQKKYPGSKPFELYAINNPLTKEVVRVEINDGVPVAKRITVPV